MKNVLDWILANVGLKELTIQSNVNNSEFLFNFLKLLFKPKHILLPYNTLIKLLNSILLKVLLHMLLLRGKYLKSTINILTKLDYQRTNINAI